jgi:hypothetical protein
MSQEVFTELTALAEAMRPILKALSASFDWTRPDMLGGFPKGACGSSSELVARYLREFYSYDAKYMSGWRASHVTHAWVQVGEVVVDLTADQYDGCPPVIVARDSRWHQQWQTEAPRNPVMPSNWPDYPYEAWERLVSGMAQAGFNG